MCLLPPNECSTVIATTYTLIAIDFVCMVVVLLFLLLFLLLFFFRFFYKYNLSHSSLKIPFIPCLYLLYLFCNGNIIWLKYTQYYLYVTYKLRIFYFKMKTKKKNKNSFYFQRWILAVVIFHYNEYIYIHLHTQIVALFRSYVASSMYLFFSSIKLIILRRFASWLVWLIAYYECVWRNKKKIFFVLFDINR